MFLCFNVLVYMDMSAEPSGTATIAMGFDDTIAAANRTWNIKVAQIPCGANYRSFFVLDGSNIDGYDCRAPSGCLQYFTGIAPTSGPEVFAGMQKSHQSFNWRNFLQPQHAKNME